MGTFYSTVSCDEEEGSRSETMSLDGFTASVTLRVPFNNKYLLVQDLLINKRKWPWLPASAAPQARTASIVPFGIDPDNIVPANGNLVYTDALVTVNYSHEEKDLISEEIEPTVDFTRLDHRNFRWSGGDPVLEPEAPGRQIRGLNFVRTYYYVSAIPVEVLTRIGQVNDANVVATTLGITFLPETLLYEPGPITRTVDTLGTDFYTVQTRFSVHPVSWNKFWRSESQTYEDMVHIATGSVYKNYPLGSFTNLMSMPQG